MDFVYEDGDDWCDFIQKLTIIADCVDVYWDSKSYTPRLKDTKKRGADALREFKAHFLAMKDKGVNDNHIDCFVDLVRVWRNTKVGKERTYNTEWLYTMWGKYLRVPMSKYDDFIRVFKKYKMPTVFHIKAEEIDPPSPYKITIGQTNEQEPISICSDVEPSGEIDLSGAWVTMDVGSNQITSKPEPVKTDPSKLEAIQLLIKALELNKTEKIQLIHSVLSLL